MQTTMLSKQSQFLRLTVASNKCCSFRLLASSSLPPNKRELEGGFESAPASKKSTKEGSIQLRAPKENSAVVHHTDEGRQHQRVWLPNSADEPLFWNEDVVKRNTQNPHNLSRLLDRIEKQELEGGRYRVKQYGVLHEDPVEDMVRPASYTISDIIIPCSHQK